MKSIRRQELLKGCVRGGVLAGVIGLCAVLTAREEKFRCNDRCGHCSKFSGGKCGLGLK
jgi:hypothetical protein